MAQYSVYVCRAWPDGHVALRDCRHPTSSWPPNSCTNLPSVHPASWKYMMQHMKVCYLIFIASSKSSQHYTCSFPTCQRTVLHVRRRLILPCGSSRILLVSRFCRPWSWLDFQNQRSPTKLSAEWYKDSTAAVVTKTPAATAMTGGTDNINNQLKVAAAMVAEMAMMTAMTRTMKSKATAAAVAAWQQCSGGSSLAATA